MCPSLPGQNQTTFRFFVFISSPTLVSGFVVQKIQSSIYGICLVEPLQDHTYQGQSAGEVKVTNFTLPQSAGETDPESSGFQLCEDIHY